MDNDKVQIATTEYKNLLKAKFELELVKAVLLNRASNGWSGKYLTWGDETTSTVIRYIIGYEYDKKLEELNDKEVSE